MALTADTRIAPAATGGAGQNAAAPPGGRTLRSRIGAAFPLSFAAFPYVDYHPSFPYSVFLGPEGAVANQPQMYWRAIGTSARAVCVDGRIGTDTWTSLLNFDPVRPRWAGRRAKWGSGATASRALPPRHPLSASLPAKAYDIDPGPAP